MKLSQRQHATGQIKLRFRGHGDATWKLETTLERYAGSPFGVRQYLSAVCQSAPAFNSLTGKAFAPRPAVDRHEGCCCSPRILSTLCISGTSGSHLRCSTGPHHRMGLCFSHSRTCNPQSETSRYSSSIRIFLLHVWLNHQRCI